MRTYKETIQKTQGGGAGGGRGSQITTGSGSGYVRSCDRAWGSQITTGSGSGYVRSCDQDGDQGRLAM